MQENITDYKGRLACKYNVETRYIESMYKGFSVSTILSIGEEFVIKRDDALTIVLRIPRGQNNTGHLQLSYEQ